MIKVDITKAKEISHNIRRDQREKEFAPYDKQVTIPYLAEQAEANRQIIREKYQSIQNDINNASDIDTLKEVINQIKG